MLSLICMHISVCAGVFLQGMAPGGGGGSQRQGDDRLPVGQQGPVGPVVFQGLPPLCQSIPPGLVTHPCQGETQSCHYSLASICGDFAVTQVTKECPW